MTPDLFVLGRVCVSIALLVLAVRWWSRACAEAFRTDIRRIRDELFDYVASNGLSFSDPAYRSTRDTLNGLMRMSNHFGPFEFLITWIAVWRNDGAPDEIGWHSEHEMLDAELSRVRNEAVGCWINFLFAHGPFGLLLRTLYFTAKLLRSADRVRASLLRMALNWMKTANSLGTSDLTRTQRYLLGGR